MTLSRHCLPGFEAILLLALKTIGLESVKFRVPPDRLGCNSADLPACAHTMSTESGDPEEAFQPPIPTNQGVVVGCLRTKACPHTPLFGVPQGGEFIINKFSEIF